MLWCTCLSLPSAGTDMIDAKTTAQRGPFTYPHFHFRSVWRKCIISTCRTASRIHLEIPPSSVTVSYGTWHLQSDLSLEHAPPKVSYRRGTWEVQLLFSLPFFLLSLSRTVPSHTVSAIPCPPWEVISFVGFCIFWYHIYIVFNLILSFALFCFSERQEKNIHP